MPEGLDKLDSATARLESAAKALASFNTGNQSTIHVNAGGVGIWLACTACAVMFAMNLGLLALYLDQQRQIASLNEYLSAIYMLSPDLKPKDQDSDGNRHNHPAAKEATATPATEAGP